MICLECFGFCIPNFLILFIFAVFGVTLDSSKDYFMLLVPRLSVYLAFTVQSVKLTATTEPLFSLRKI